MMLYTLLATLSSPVSGHLLVPGCPVVETGESGIKGAIGTCVWMPPSQHAPAARLAVWWETIVPSMVTSPTCGTALNLHNTAGMDRAARWLSLHYGVPLGPTAPGWWRWTPAGGGWALGSPGPDPTVGALIFHSGDILAIENSRGQTWITVPGISALTNPMEALALACLHAVRIEEAA